MVGKTKAPTILLNKITNFFADYEGGDYTIVDSSVYPEGFSKIPFKFS